MFLLERAPGADQSFETIDLERLNHPRFRGLDDDKKPIGIVVGDRSPDALLVEAPGNTQIRVGRLQLARRMVMDHDRALVGIAGSGQHSRLVAPRDSPWLDQHSIRADSSEETHLPATSFLHLRTDLLGGVG